MATPLATCFPNTCRLVHCVPKQYAPIADQNFVGCWHCTSPLHAAKEMSDRMKSLPSRSKDGGPDAKRARDDAEEIGKECALVMSSDGSGPVTLCNYCLLPSFTHVRSEKGDKRVCIFVGPMRTVLITVFTNPDMRAACDVGHAVPPVLPSRGRQA